MIKLKALKNRTCWIYFFVLFVFFQFFPVSSVYGADLSCPGGRWVQVSSCSRYAEQGGSVYERTTFHGEKRYVYITTDVFPGVYPATCIYWTAEEKPFECSGAAILPGPDSGLLYSICTVVAPYDWVNVLRRLTVDQWQCPSVCTDGQTKPCPYTGPAGTENIGECKAGVQTCVNGQWGACEGEVLPQAEICGDGKDNNCDGNKDEGCETCEVSVKVSPSTVWPLIPQPQGPSGYKKDWTKADVVVTLSKPAPQEGCTVNLKVEPEAYSGGHSHDGNRPKGTVTPDSISFSQGEIGAQSGKYKSSEVAGEEKIKAKVNDKDTSETIIQVKVPGFFELGAGDGYVLIGQTNTHPDNHHGSENTLSSLLDIANAYLEKEKGTLRINDISLEWGGLFDIKANWSSLHKSHRIGKNVDVDDVTAEGKKVRPASLKKVAEKLGIKVTILDEGNHLHLTFQ